MRRQIMVMPNYSAPSSITEIVLTVVLHFLGEDVSALWSIWFSLIFTFLGDYPVALKGFWSRNNVLKSVTQTNAQYQELKDID